MKEIITCIWCGGDLGTYCQTIDEGYICADCAVDLRYCAHCGAEIHVEESEWFDEKPFCGDCYERLFDVCDVCGEIHHKEYGKNTQRGFVCHECLEMVVFVECAVCHELTDEHTAYQDENGETQWMCLACWEYLRKLMAVCAK